MQPRTSLSKCGGDFIQFCSFASLGASGDGSAVGTPCPWTKPKTTYMDCLVECGVCVKRAKHKASGFDTETCEEMTSSQQRQTVIYHLQSDGTGHAWTTHTVAELMAMDEAALVALCGACPIEGAPNCFTWPAAGTSAANATNHTEALALRDHAEVGDFWWSGTCERTASVTTHGPGDPRPDSPTYGAPGYMEHPSTAQLAQF